MIRFVVAALLASLPLAARAQTAQQTLVDRATLTVQEMMSGEGGTDARRMLRQARGAMICPRVFKAGFILGGQGGDCVLVGRGNGSWSSPAFYTMGSGSIGLQLGVQDAEIIFLVLTDRGLTALLDSQFKIGGDATVAVASYGGGVSGATTAAFHADIVSFAQARGLYAGLSVDGSLISARSDWNSGYYGQPLAAQQIVLGGAGQNPGAAPLREILAQFAAPEAPVAPQAAPYASGPPQAAMPNAGQVAMSPSAPVTSSPLSAPVSATPLAPPRR